METSKESDEESGIMEVQESVDQAPPGKDIISTPVEGGCICHMYDDGSGMPPLFIGSGSTVRLASCIVLGMLRAEGLGGALSLRKEFTMSSENGVRSFKRNFELP
jgi:hypothetical protein